MMAPVTDEREAMHWLRVLLSQTPDRCRAREILEATLPILDRQYDERGERHDANHALADN